MNVKCRNTRLNKCLRSNIKKTALKNYIKQAHTVTKYT